MYIIDRIEIDGFWNRFNISQNLNHDINIFIGANGTGKTTLINILRAALTVDFISLESLDFNEVRIWVIQGKSRKKITLTKIESDFIYDLLVYKIGNKKFKLPLIPKGMDIRRRLHSRHLAEINELKEKFDSIIDISWLSVHRETTPEERYSSKRDYSKSEIDIKLDHLMKRLALYQLQIQGKTSTISSEFQKEVLVLMLYSREFDRFKFEGKEVYDLDNLKKQLTHAYQDLGIFNKTVKNRINNHFEKIEESLSKIEEQSSNEYYNINDVLPISVLQRTQEIVNLSRGTDNEKKLIREPLTSYINLLSSFISDKQLEINEGDDEEPLTFYKDNYKLSLNELSSGEKQLIIHLTETLLQRKNRCIFLADEPELSLHISWQQKLLSSTRNINPNSQVIVATHSPEIAGEWRNNIIDMRSMFNG